MCVSYGWSYPGVVRIEDGVVSVQALSQIQTRGFLHNEPNCLQ